MLDNDGRKRKTLSDRLATAKKLKTSAAKTTIDTKASLGGSSRKHAVDFFDHGKHDITSTDLITEDLVLQHDENSNISGNESTLHLSGFESSSEHDSDNDSAAELEIAPHGVTQTRKPIPTNKSDKISHNQNEEPGAVYLGHIPHGFYEQEMRSYFSQFGSITRLKLSRNKVTGKSKHYAFIEFASSSVAEIVADTMDNYLLFGHILKCKVVPSEQNSEKMWAGANRKWKVAPITKIRRLRNDSKKSQEKWEKLEEKEAKRREAKQTHWLSVGIDYSFKPQTMAVKHIVERTTQEILPPNDLPMPTSSTRRKSAKGHKKV